MDDNVWTGLEAGEPSVAEQGLPDRGGIITARGTLEGLVVRLDGRVDPHSLRAALSDFMVSRRSFLAGQEVTLEWLSTLPDEGFISGLGKFLAESFDVRVRASRLVERAPAESAASQVRAPSVSTARKSLTDEVELSTATRDRSPSLFDGVPSLTTRGAAVTGSAALWDDPDARMIYATVRSGQKVESEHSIVVFGDVNSGAEIIAGGDVVVLGTLRGIAHAGAYDEAGGGRVVFALNMLPTQLRIGSIISRGAGESHGHAEVARVDGTLIVVEPYQSKSGSSWRRR